MKEKGKVVEITDFIAKVSLEPGEACKTCPYGNFCRPAGTIRIIKVKNGIGAKVGDEVYIGIPVKSEFIAIFLLFGLPVMLGLIGLLIGTLYTEIHSVILGLVGFALGLIIAKIVNNILGRKKKLLPCIIEIINPKRALKKYSSLS